MTNLEAIEELRDIDRHLDIVFERTLPKKAEAIHLAVKALEEHDDAGYEQGWADGYAVGIGGDDE